MHKLSVPCLGIDNEGANANEEEQSKQYNSIDCITRHVASVGYGKQRYTIQTTYTVDSRVFQFIFHSFMRSFRVMKMCLNDIAVYFDATTYLLLLENSIWNKH